MNTTGNRKNREWLSLQIVKNPSRVILVGIILINLFFILFSAFLITILSPATGTHRSFVGSLFYTITMIMDAGCISFIVQNPNPGNALISVVCLFIILIGMIIFTGGIIGYISNVISDFIDNSNAGKSPLVVSKHTIILNWNSRASEIINDMLYSEFPEVVVVLVSENRKEVEKEIDERLADTISRERKAVLKETEGMNFFDAFWHKRLHNFHSRVSVIVRQGDPFSNKQLMDISIDKAKAVIILNKDRMHSGTGTVVKAEEKQRKRGNSLTVKTLTLVAELTAAETSANDQKIIVEVVDPWTADIVNKIISHKEKLEKCNIVPIYVYKILGQLMSQFSIVPELNMVYNELFSKKGAEFYSIPFDIGIDTRDNFLAYFSDHAHAIPLASIDTKIGRQWFFMSDKSHDLILRSEIPRYELSVKTNPDYWQPKRNIMILGHNSNTLALMAGFESYRNEWNPAKDGSDILNICVLDDKEGLAAMNYYRDYSYVNAFMETDLFDQDTIYKTINDFINEYEGDTRILILSDDAVSREDLDATALTYLIYVQDIMTQRKAMFGGKDTERIDVVVEILNPKNYDVVRSYSVDNIVISNRYISKMLGQIGEKDSLFEFYNDILAYDDAGTDEYVSKELYIKTVKDFFIDVPPTCTAAELIRAIYADSKAQDSRNIAILLGYITEDDEMVIFVGDQREIEVSLHENDKLILFSNH